MASDITDNKYANSSNTFGRPRKHDRQQIAIDIVEWAKKPDSINLNKFCAYYDPIIAPSKLTLWRDEDPNFREAYECAKAFLGARREEKLNNEELHVKAYDLNANVYDFFLKEERREQAAYEAKLAKEVGAVVNEKDLQRHEEVMQALNNAQKSDA